MINVRTLESQVGVNGAQEIRHGHTECGQISGYNVVEKCKHTRRIVFSLCLSSSYLFSLKFVKLLVY